MPDVYATVGDQPRETQELVVRALDLRGQEPEMAALTQRYLTEIELPAGAHVLELGCGSGFATRRISGLANVARVIGIDPSPVFLEHARANLADEKRVEFQQADARQLPIEADCIDAVISHTTLCHVPEVERAIAEALRVLRPGGQLVVFDGDYATMNMAIGDFDPIQTCVEAFLDNYVHDKWFMRRLPRLVREAGFEHASLGAHGYVKVSDPKYLRTVVQRGTQTLAANGTIGEGLVASIEQEIERRLETGQFFGVIMFASLVAKKPH